MSLRVQRVSVAVVYDRRYGFFLTFNPHWGGYAFPMKKCSVNDDEILGEAAIRAYREVIEVSEPPKAESLDYLEVECDSRRTNQRTRYLMHLFAIKPPEDLVQRNPQLGFASRGGFLPYNRFAGADLVSYNSRLIRDVLIDNQRVALVIVYRRTGTGAEFLMVYNQNYHGYFPIASRLRGDVTATEQALLALQKESGYAGRFVPRGIPRVVTDTHHSDRFDCDRQFYFTLVSLRSAEGLDLSAEKNPLWQALSRKFLYPRWVTEAELAKPEANQLSPTLVKLREALLDIARE